VGAAEVTFTEIFEAIEAHKHKVPDLALSVANSWLTVTHNQYTLSVNLADGHVVAPKIRSALMLIVDALEAGTSWRFMRKPSGAWEACLKGSEVRFDRDANEPVPEGDREVITLTAVVYYVVTKKLENNGT
jgi:hypothetical protein